MINFKYVKLFDKEKYIFESYLEAEVTNLPCQCVTVPKLAKKYFCLFDSSIKNCIDKGQKGDDRHKIIESSLALIVTILSYSRSHTINFLFRLYEVEVIRKSFRRVAILR